MFRPLLNDKIGNILIYFADHIKSLSLMKAIKLLYILDETAMKEIGVPMTWFEYKAWKHGPVPEELHNELKKNIVETYSGKPIDLKGYITTTIVPNPVDSNAKDAVYITAGKEFDDGDFTDYEMELMDRIVSEFGKFSVEKLISYLHKEGSLWDKVVKENNLEFVFDLQGGSKSDYYVPLVDLLKGDEQKQMVYRSAYNSLDFQAKIR